MKCLENKPLTPRYLSIVAAANGKDSKKRGTRSVTLESLNPGTLESFCQLILGVMALNRERTKAF